MHRSTTAIITSTVITRTECFFKNTCLDLLIGVCFLRDACHELFCFFGDLFGTGTLDAEVTKSLNFLPPLLVWQKATELTGRICQTRCRTPSWVRSCCGVPAQIFKLLLVYFYVLITSVCISSVFFFVFFRAKLIK